MSLELRVDQARDGLERGRPVAVAAAEYRVANAGEGAGGEPAVAQPVAETPGIVGGRAVVGRGGDEDRPLAGQPAGVLVERGHGHREALPLAGLGDPPRDLLRGA